MKYNSAFSLLELSIVLVIIGLIAGGIVAGSSMIRAAEIRSVATQIEHYKIATYTFKDKYLAMPGDMKNATDFWGIQAGATGDDATCFDSVSTDKATCNGDGNTQLSNLNNVGYENFRFFQHLANAELINGTFTGVGSVTSPAHSGCEIGVNCPELKVSGVTMQVRTSPSVAINVNSYALKSGMGAIVGTVVGNNNPDNAAFSTQEAWNIDKKLDDGRPALGKVITHVRNGATASWAAGVRDCANNADPNVAEYDLQLEGDKCALRVFY